MVKKCGSERAVEQFNGRKGAGSDFVIALSVKLKRAWRRFRPTSSQPLSRFSWH